MILEKNITSKTEFLYIKVAQQNINIRSTLDFKTVINRLYTIIYYNLLKKNQYVLHFKFWYFLMFLYTALLQKNIKTVLKWRNQNEPS